MVWVSCMAGRLRGRMKNEYDFSKGGGGGGGGYGLERNVENRVTCLE